MAQVQTSATTEKRGCSHHSTLFHISAIILVLCSQLITVSAEFLERLPKPPYVGNAASALPSIVIIGTAKGGTTDLYEQLADKSLNSHPDRLEPPVSRGPTKEASFLGDDTDPTKISARLGDYMRRLAHPCSTANATVTDDLQSCIQAQSANHITLDATPTYIFLPTAPMQLAAFSPESKVVVMLRDPVERAEILFRHYIVDQGRFKNVSFDALTDNFFAYVASNPGVRDGLQRLSNTTSVTEMAEGWRMLRAAGLLDNMERQIFAGGLYRYALAIWRLYYFKPSRFIVIDSHEYYRNRVSVMEEVVSFVYGRPLNAIERELAGKQSFWRKGPPALSRAGNNWQLSPAQREKLQAFYRKHVLKDLGGMLVEMGQEGGWMVGFQDAPWTRYRSFASK